MTENKRNNVKTILQGVANTLLVFMRQVMAFAKSCYRLLIPEIIKRAIDIILNRKPKAKTWENSQEYEFRAAVSFMKDNIYKEIVSRTVESKKNHTYTLNIEFYMNEFFNNDVANYNAYAKHIENKNCLEIGPSVVSTLCTAWWTKNNFIIEPLLDQIMEYQRHDLGFSLFDDTTNFAKAANIHIPELDGSIDGAIICRNCLDHTPEWFFILNNISSYAKPGALFLFWSDLYHNLGVDEGHYNITKDVEEFKRLLYNFGFKIQHQYSIPNRDTVNFGCIAVKYR